MLKDVQNSIKAKLYDFTYSPFMSSMIISWIIINHKYILIYMASYNLEKKLVLLEQYDFSWQTTWFHVPWTFNIWLPILFGLFYTFIYPRASKKFYEFTLEKNKELKKIKQDIEDKTPLTIKESVVYRESSRECQSEVDKLKKEISNIHHSEQMTKIVKEIFKRLVVNSKDEEIIFLKYLHNLENKSMEESSLLKGIVSSTIISESNAKTIFDNLKNKYILNETGNFINVTITGMKTMHVLFDK